MTVQEKGWKEIAPAGVCPKSSSEFLTGDWKTYQPVRDTAKCTRCLLCVLFCPDGAISEYLGIAALPYRQVAMTRDDCAPKHKGSPP